jgi:hypothetical protein
LKHHGPQAVKTTAASKKECPAMKGFETKMVHIGKQIVVVSKKECPAMKGFETRRRLAMLELRQIVRRNAPL